MQPRTRSNEIAWRGAPNKSTQGATLTQSANQDEKVKKARCAASPLPNPVFLSVKLATAANKAFVHPYSTGFTGRCWIRRAAGVGVYCALPQVTLPPTENSV